MSGIYIKGMEMPKSCWDCFACHDGWCIINQKIEGHRTVTHSCPLISVPDHGRLVDADALNDMINRSYPMTDRVDVHNGYAICQEMMKVLPTIISVEEGE